MLLFANFLQKNTRICYTGVDRAIARGIFFLRGNREMKQALRREFTNIVFLILIVAAAVVIYLLSRAETAATAEQPAETTAIIAADEEEAQASTTAAAEKNTPRGVPEAVLLTHLATSETFSADEDGHNKRTFAITFGDAPPVETSLRYELQDDCISSMEITFAIPMVPKDKGKTKIDAYLYESAQTLVRIHGDAVLAILGDALPATDAKDELQISSVRFWVEQALLLKKNGDKFEDTQGGYHFLAYRSQGEVSQELICVFYLT